MNIFNFVDMSQLLTEKFVQLQPLLSEENNKFKNKNKNKKRRFFTVDENLIKS